RSASIPSLAWERLAALPTKERTHETGQLTQLLVRIGHFGIHGILDGLLVLQDRDGVSVTSPAGVGILDWLPLRCAAGELGAWLVVGLNVGVFGHDCRSGLQRVLCQLCQM